MGIKTGICVLLLLCGLVAAQEDVAKQGECIAGQINLLQLRPKAMIRFREDETSGHADN